MEVSLVIKGAVPILGDKTTSVQFHLCKSRWGHISALRICRCLNVIVEEHFLLVERFLFSWLHNPGAMSSLVFSCLLLLGFGINSLITTALSLIIPRDTWSSPSFVLPLGLCHSCLCLSIHAQCMMCFKIFSHDWKKATHVLCWEQSKDTYLHWLLYVFEYYWPCYFDGYNVIRNISLTPAGIRGHRTLESDPNASLRSVRDPAWRSLCTSHCILCLHSILGFGSRFLFSWAVLIK